MKQSQTEIQTKMKQVGQKTIVLEKSKMIELLEQKNAVLFKEVQRIQKIVEEYDKKALQKPNQSNKSTIETTSNDPDILSKQLKNCYKQIKIYEFEVQKLKSRTLSVEISDKLIAIDRQLKQKKLIQDRLKQQLNSTIKQIADYSKKLSGNNHQFEIGKQYKKKSDELRFLKEMIKDYDSKEQIKQKNLKLEYAHIKNLQKQFMENGGSVNDLQTVKRKALSQFQQGRLVKRQVTKENQDVKFSTNKNSLLSNQSIVNNFSYNLTPDESENNRSKSNYESMLNELSVLQKLNKKYEKQFQESEKIINDIQAKTQLKKLRLQKLQKQIQEMNSSIKLKKTCIVAENMKPAHRRLSLKSVNAKEDTVNITSIEPANKRKRNIINMTAIINDREQRLYHN